MASKASFHWDDPLLLEQQLSDDERAVREAARAYSQDRLLPRVLEAFRHGTTDVAIFREMGELGLLGATLPEQYGGGGMNYVCYGLVAREVEPHALAWEDAGMTPREVLVKLGAAGLLGLMYDSAHGGADADALTNLVFAEALSQSTFGGFIITVLVHTDMASPHLHHAGNAEQKARWMPGITAGETITAVAITEPGAGSDVAGIRTTAARSIKVNSREKRSFAHATVRPSTYATFPPTC